MTARTAQPALDVLELLAIPDSATRRNALVQRPARELERWMARAIIGIEVALKADCSPSLRCARANGWLEILRDLATAAPSAHFREKGDLAREVRSLTATVQTQGRARRAA